MHLPPIRIDRNSYRNTVIFIYCWTISMRISLSRDYYALERLHATIK